MPSDVQKDKLNQKGTKFSIPYETSDTDIKTEVKESEIHMEIAPGWTCPFQTSLIRYGIEEWHSLQSPCGACHSWSKK